MARPKKNNAEYFSHDAGMRNDVRIKALRRKFSHAGYAVWNYILEILTDADFFAIEWDEIQVELLSGDFDVEPGELSEIVDYCLKLGLLQKENGKLFSKKHQERFSSLISKREYNKNRVSVTETKQKPPKNGVSVTETPKNRILVAESTQSKGEYSIVKESIEETLSNDNVEEKEKEKENAPSGAPSASPSPDIKDFGECRFYGLDELMMRMQSDGGWIRAVGENLKLKEKPGGAAGAIYEFIEELRIKGVKSKREDDAKQHFVNWIRIKQKQENDDATNSYTPTRRVYQGTGKPGQSFNNGGKPKRYGEDTYRPNPNRKT